MNVSPHGQRLLNILTAGATLGLPLGRNDKDKYIQSLRDMDKHDPEKFVFENLIGNLNILDFKANSTLLFVPILTAIYLYIIGEFNKKEYLHDFWTDRLLVVG